MFSYHLNIGFNKPFYLKEEHEFKIHSKFQAVLLHYYGERIIDAALNKTVIK